jgi:hypothetical protein
MMTEVFMLHSNMLKALDDMYDDRGIYVTW